MGATGACASDDKLLRNVRTFELTLPPGPLAWESLPAAPARRWVRWFASFVLAMALLIGLQRQVPYFVFMPGTARQVNDLVRVPADKKFPPQGRVLLTTVSLQQRPTVWEVLHGWLDADEDVFPEDQILGTASRDDLRKQNILQMDESKQVAVVVALRRLGHAVTERGEGALVEGVFENVPAQGYLVPGDVIVAVDTKLTPLRQDVQAGIRTHRPGENVHLDVISASGAKRVVDVPLIARPGDETAFLGVQLRTKGLRFDLPFPVDIDSVGIGGPSAGLAYSLAVIDALTPGELTGGKRIAATGQIQSDGTIADIGGINQKVAAARAAKAEVFLVPLGNLKGARARAGSLKVIGVASLEQALDELGRLGGDVAAIGPLPPNAYR